ncbi:MAG TPA: DUF6691 family protein [Sphingomicrobium sp.]|nr:DUF6691 family protein [Sphingomicrobium sp.]
MASRLVPPVLSGALFGGGLAIGGMTDPQRVRGFLDLFGRWDPTLAFVMAGAVIVMALAWRVRERMTKPVFAPQFSLPGRGEIDMRLIGGSALFGIGWGLAGLCPGPAVANLALAPAQVLPFLAAMLAGMAAHNLLPSPK